MLGLSAVTVLAVCLLVYLTINRALQPASIIVAGLERMEKGNLAYRLPPFDLDEWQRTAEAINQLAASQFQLLAERQKLAVKLISLQEEERRFLARELHDEFGQCLAAINAVAVSIAQTAAQQCPSLVAETHHISRITQHMMDSARDLLRRLRPAEVALNSLRASNNAMQTQRSWCSACIKTQVLRCKQVGQALWATSPKAVRRKFVSFPRSGFTAIKLMVFDGVVGADLSAQCG